MTPQTHGERRRAEIVAAAADLSTTEGLASLSLSRIAAEVGLTKAGVAAHFDSKEALQLAVVDAAAWAYRSPLAGAEEASAPGLDRLRHLMEAWLDHVESVAFRGGCFFAAAGHDFSGRPGPVRDAVSRWTRRLIAMLEEQARLAARLGELRDDVDPALLVFSLHAVVQEANLRRVLLDHDDAFDAARRALVDLLSRAARSQEESP